MSRSFDQWADDLAVHINKKNTPEEPQACVGTLTIHNPGMNTVQYSASSITLTSLNNTQRYNAMLEHFKAITPDKRVEILWDMISNFESWDKTPEGVTFWSEVYNKLEEKL